MTIMTTEWVFSSPFYSCVTFVLWFFRFPFDNILTFSKMRTLGTHLYALCSPYRSPGRKLFSHSFLITCPFPAPSSYHYNLPKSALTTFANIFRCRGGQNRFTRRFNNWLDIFLSAGCPCMTETSVLNLCRYLYMSGNTVFYHFIISST